ncbi:hypothetical protein [Aurantiacibacter gangjinensis]|uniref:Uncharacterized protein n=1 Tax=Aurantiacibacter gangjinensis TaxID=502682 RepID=A0A0G9MRD6_9SPHN|nr:hypothetical protein [Aurantiacibacter gangjinensis]APE29237.1 TonB-dependent receptor [Aurantiacibacter gangjinensis]KLE33292.1 hypothetical protein AAW01_04910 [Aurantiacibacter gangjinensis]
MRFILSCSAIALASASFSTPVGAQDAPPEPPQDEDTPAPEDSADDDLNQIVVIGARLAGLVDTDQPPILELDEEAIAAYGAATISDLVELLGPQVSSNRGRGGGGQVFLVNGRRISSFRELRSYPSEAIERFEVLNEETALEFGYSADQRVVNIILKDDFSSTTVELEYSQPWAGGFSNQEADIAYLRLNDPSRLNLNVEVNNSTLLTEAERGIIQPDSAVPTFSTDPDPAAFRSLRGESTGVEATANWTTAIGDAGTSLSLNATYGYEEGTSFQGLDSVLLQGPDPASAPVLRTFNALDPLVVDRDGDSYSFGATLNTEAGDWEITATADANLASGTSRIANRFDTADLRAAALAGDLALDAPLGPFPDAGFAVAQNDTYRITSLLTAQTDPLLLPGGDVSLTLVAGYVGNGIESSDTRSLSDVLDLDRSRFQLGASTSIPLTSRREDFGDAIGDVSLNFSANLFEQSDFGTLFDWTAGAVWGLTERLSLTATYFSAESSPSLTQLGSNTIATPNVPVFDFLNNETVFATVVTGGNPLLPAQQQSDWKFGLNWELPEFASFIDNGRVQIEYFDNHSEDTTAGFPVLTPAIEAAFPGRVTRDVDGTLLELDNRFVTFAEQDVRRLSVQFNFRGSFGGAEEEAGGPGGGGPPQGARGGRPGGGQGSGQGAGPGGGAGRPGAAQFAALREQFCGTDPEVLLERFNAAAEAAANGEDPPVDEEGNPIVIPPQILQRLTGENGRIDPERFAALRERFCAAGGPPAAGQARGGGRGGGRGRGRGFGRFGGGDDGPPQWNWFAGFNYAYEFENTVLIAEGIPRLDLLEGDALSGGGQPRHTLRWFSGIFYDGMGVLPFARYVGPSRIEGSELAGSTDLFFSDLFTLDIRTFVDLGERDWLVEAVPFFENTRISFDVENVFDARQRVTDSNGDVPLRYQPFLIDPVGRSFEIEFRKLF